MKLLESELVKAREVIGDVFEDYRLIKPGIGYFDSGIYNCRCSLIAGTRSTFKEFLIKTSSGIDVSNLYFVGDGNYDALQLIPFIMMMPSPKTQENACYFYNRTDENGVRMVSYYFEKDADFTISDESIVTLIKSLEN